MKSLNVGLIGAGRRAHATHLKVLEQFGKDRINFTAVCDINPKTVQSVSEKYNVRGYTNLRDMIASEKLDVCIVTVPEDAHHSVSCFLSQNGIHHLMETPIAPHPILAQLMIDTAAKHGVKLGVAENFPSMPVEQMSLKVLRSNALGQVGRIYRLFSTVWYHGIAVMNDRAGGNPVKVHSVDHSFPVVPYKDGSNRTFDKEELEFGIIYYDNGVMGIFLVGNKNSALGRNKLVGFETDCAKGILITNGNQSRLGGEEIRVATEASLADGGKTESAFYQREYKEIDGVQTIQKMWVDVPEYGTITWENEFADYALPENVVSVAYMQDSMYKAIERNEPLRYTPEQAKREMEIILATKYSAARDGAGVTLPLQLEPHEEEQLKQYFINRYGKDLYDIDGLIDISFPRD